MGGFLHFRWDEKRLSDGGSLSMCISVFMNIAFPLPRHHPSPTPLLRSLAPLACSLLTVYCYCDSAPDEMWAKNMSLLNTGLSEVVCISLLTRLSIYDSQPKYCILFIDLFALSKESEFLTDFDSYLCRLVKFRFSLFCHCFNRAVGSNGSID